jgi:hypothetical protein
VNSTEILLLLTITLYKGSFFLLTAKAVQGNSSSTWMRGNRSLNSRKCQNIPLPRETLKYGNLFEVIATASLMAEYLTGSFSVAVILNTEVRSSEIMAGKSFAALSSFSQPRSRKGFLLMALPPDYIL